jgi:hypothetical protein
MVIFMILWRPAGQHLHRTIHRIRGRMEFSSGVGSKSRFFTVARVFGLGPGLGPVQTRAWGIGANSGEASPLFLSNVFGSDIPEMLMCGTMLKLA